MPYYNFVHFAYCAWHSGHVWKLELSFDLCLRAGCPFKFSLLNHYYFCSTVIWNTIFPFIKRDFFRRKEDTDPSPVPCSVSTLVQKSSGLLILSQDSVYVCLSTICLIQTRTTIVTSKCQKSMATLRAFLQFLMLMLFSTSVLADQNAALCQVGPAISNIENAISQSGQMLRELREMVNQTVTGCTSSPQVVYPACATAQAPSKCSLSCTLCELKGTYFSSPGRMGPCSTSAHGRPRLQPWFGSIQRRFHWSVRHVVGVGETSSANQNSSKSTIRTNGKCSTFI